MVDNFALSPVLCLALCPIRFDSTQPSSSSAVAGALYERCANVYVVFDGLIIIIIPARFGGSSYAENEDGMRNGTELARCRGSSHFGWEINSPCSSFTYFSSSLFLARQHLRLIFFSCMLRNSIFDLVLAFIWVSLNFNEGWGTDWVKFLAKWRRRNWKILLWVY